MRRMAGITLGTIFRELHAEGINISRSTLIRREKDGYFESKRSGKRWRFYTRAEANAIKQIIREDYNIG